MSAVEPLLQNITALTPLTMALVALAGLIVGVAPSSFPLISVAAGLTAGQDAMDAGERRIKGLRLSLGFVLGIVTVDAVLGALFGFFGFAVLRLLVGYLALVYVLIAVALTMAGLALLHLINIVVPVLTPSAKRTRSFLGSYLLGLPFGLSTCPACTPLLLPVVAASAATADPVMGAVLMATFGVARGVPIVVAGVASGSLAHLKQTRRFTVWAERIGGVLMLAAALYFFYQAAFYAGWLSP